MNTTNPGNPPDIDPANNDTLAGVMRFAFYKLLQNTDGMLPAKVIKYDRATNRVQVQLLIAVVTTNNAQVTRPQIASLPVCIMGGGGFMLNFNLVPGDLGWVLANDRDISLFLQNYTQTPPNTGRIKNFSDGLFIPNIMTGFTIDDEDINNVVLQSTDGILPNKVKISFGTGVINLVVTDGVNTSTIAMTPNAINITATDVIINGYDFGPLGITGPLGIFQVEGDIQATGLITPNTP